MKKALKIYSIIWLLSVAVYNAVVFLLPREMFDVDRWRQDGFWVGYALTMVVFAGQLVASILCLRQTDTNRVFLRLSLPLTANAALIASLIFGSVFMIFAAVPGWIGSVVGLLLLLYYAVAILKAQIAITVIEGVDTRIQQQTASMRTMTNAAYNTLQAANDDTRIAAKKVWEALRYSDPVSCQQLAGVEAMIGDGLAHFHNTVLSGDANGANAEADELLRLIRERNQDCKSFKSMH